MRKIDLYKIFLKTKRPIEKNVLKKIEENLKARYIYNSNGIEGNTLSLMETNLIIEHGVTIKGKSLKEHLEVKGQEYALNFLSDVIKEKEDISLKLIREFNSLIMVNGGGTFKKFQNEIVGANFTTSPPHLVEEHLNELIKNYYNSEESIVKKVAIFHADFEKIHPFPDGNGRTGRLLINLELMKEGFPITIIKKEDREDYYNALEEAHTNQNYVDIIKFIENNIEKSFEFYFEHISNDWKNEFDKFVYEFVKTNFENNEDFLEYLKDNEFPQDFINHCEEFLDELETQELKEELEEGQEREKTKKKDREIEF